MSPTVKFWRSRRVIQTRSRPCCVSMSPRRRRGSVPQEEEEKNALVYHRAAGARDSIFTERPSCTSTRETGSLLLRPPSSTHTHARARAHTNTLYIALVTLCLRRRSNLENKITTDCPKVAESRRSEWGSVWAGLPDWIIRFSTYSRFKSVSRKL